jgi:SAM-dependent methyltransferase
LSEHVPIREEAEMSARYTGRYQPAVKAAGLAAELEAVGSDYGANGYLSMAQADELLGHLALTPDDELLDIGSGQGWPGLYLAKQSGCRLVVSDLTVAGMRNALQRAAEDGTASRTTAVVASARHLPFRPDSFDAIVHADVLC